MEGPLEPRTAQPRRPWTVKYDGHCSRCGLTLRRGEVAVYDRRSKTIRCVECPAGSIPPPAVDTPAIDALARTLSAAFPPK